MRLIDADAFKDYIMDGIADHDDIPPLQFSVVEAAAKGFLLDIDEQPTISPDEVRGVGKWEHQELAPTNWTFCSVCGRQRSKKYKWYYCPNCGAKMKGVSEDANN